MSESESAPHTSPVATPMRGSMVICKERLKEILVAPRVFEVCIRFDRRVSPYTLGLVFHRWPGACTKCEHVDMHIRIRTLSGWPANTYRWSQTRNTENQNIRTINPLTWRKLWMSANIPCPAVQIYTDETMSQHMKPKPTDCLLFV